MITEPDITKEKKKKDWRDGQPFRGVSFFDSDLSQDVSAQDVPDYESILPQDRAAQAKETKQPDVNVQPPTSKQTPEDILKKIYSYRPPTPTYDKNRPEEMKRLAKASAIGKGLNLVGDVIGLSAGAPIKRRPKDEKELGYLQSMYSYMDDYNERMDEWNWRDYVQKLKAGELTLSQANLEEERKLREKMYESEQLWKMLGFKSDQAYKEHQMELGKTKAELAREEFEYQKEKDKREEAIDWEKLQIDKDYRDRIATSRMIRAKAYETKAESSKKYALYDSKGNPVEIAENENFKIISLILEDPLSEITSDEIDLLKAKFGTPMSTNTINTLIQKYWEETPLSRDYVYSKYGKPGQAEEKTGKKSVEGNGENDIKQKWGGYAR